MERRAFAVRVRDVQEWMEEEGLGGVLAVPGIDSYQDEGARVFVNYLLRGASGPEVGRDGEGMQSRGGKEEGGVDLDDVVVAVTRECLGLVVPPQSKWVSGLVGDVDNVRVFTLPGGEGEGRDEEAVEVFKTEAFNHMVDEMFLWPGSENGDGDGERPVLGVPIYDLDEGYEGDPMVMERWPLVQAYAHVPLPGEEGSTHPFRPAHLGGFFTMLFDVRGIHIPALDSLYGSIDLGTVLSASVAAQDQLARNYSFVFSTLMASKDTGYPGDRALVEPLWFYYQYGRLDKSRLADLAPLPRFPPSVASAVSVGEEEGVHVVCVRVCDPVFGLAMARTLFVHRGTGSVERGMGGGLGGGVGGGLGGGMGGGVGGRVGGREREGGKRSFSLFSFHPGFEDDDDDDDDYDDYGHGYGHGYGDGDGDGEGEGNDGVDPSLEMYREMVRVFEEQVCGCGGDLEGLVGGMVDAMERVEGVEDVEVEVEVTEPGRSGVRLGTVHLTAMIGACPVVYGNTYAVAGKGVVDLTSTEEGRTDVFLNQRLDGPSTTGRRSDGLVPSRKVEDLCLDLGEGEAHVNDGGDGVEVMVVGGAPWVGVHAFVKGLVDVSSYQWQVVASVDEAVAAAAAAAAEEEGERDEGEVRVILVAEPYVDLARIALDVLGREGLVLGNVVGVVHPRGFSVLSGGKDVSCSPLYPNMTSLTRDGWVNTIVLREPEVESVDHPLSAVRVAIKKRAPSAHLVLGSHSGAVLHPGAIDTVLARRAWDEEDQARARARGMSLALDVAEKVGSRIGKVVTVTLPTVMDESRLLHVLHNMLGGAVDGMQVSEVYGEVELEGTGVARVVGVAWQTPRVVLVPVPAEEALDGLGLRLVGSRIDKDQAVEAVVDAIPAVAEDENAARDVYSLSASEIAQIREASRSAEIPPGFSFDGRGYVDEQGGRWHDHPRFGEMKREFVEALNRGAEERNGRLEGDRVVRSGEVARLVALNAAHEHDNSDER